MSLGLSTVTASVVRIIGIKEDRCGRDETPPEKTGQMLGSHPDPAPASDEKVLCIFGPRQSTRKRVFKISAS